jgi:uncharacterized membrane protein YfcA
VNGVDAADLLVLAGAGVLAGIASTVVSLASLVSYPTLLAVGLPPVSANVTNTVALLFTAFGAAAGSRPELAGQGRRVLRLGALAGLGGAVGAALLLVTPESSFEAVAPWLIGGASALLLVQPRLTATVFRDGHEHTRWLLLALFGVTVYTGYFGAAGGILVLVVLGAMLDEPLVRVNAVKNALAGASNGVAALGFALFGPVVWTAVAPLALGFLVGGWVGPRIARRLPARGLRLLVGLCGLAVAVRLGLDAYG